MSNRYFTALTGIRFIAATMVYFHHFNPFPPRSFISKITSELHIGVTFFFVLSGFLIAYRYAFDTINLKKFFFNRLARIYPMYFLISSLFFANFIYHNQVVIIDFIKLYLLNITFLKGFSERYKFTGVAQGWTLTVEELFYLLSPLFFYFLSKSKKYFFILPIILLILGILLVEVFTKYPYESYFKNYEFMFNYSFFGRCSEFFIGIALAYLVKSEYQFNFKYFTFTGVFVTFICLLGIVYLKGNYDYGIRHPMGKLINNLLLPLFGISFIYYGLLKENSIISKVLSYRLFDILGKSSYVFYLIHMGIINNWISRYTNSILINFFLLNIISIILFV